MRDPDEMAPENPMTPLEHAELWALPAGVLTTFTVGSITTSFQSSTARAGVVAFLLITVALVAVVGRRAAGAMTGLSAALSFDFFHVTPLRTLHLPSFVWAASAFVLVGVAAGWKRTSRPAASDPRSPSPDEPGGLIVSELPRPTGLLARADVIAPLSALASFGVAAALVGVRGTISSAVTAVALAAVVALAGRLGGYVAALTSALVAALSFDFLHTEPYLSLKIANVEDILVTLLLLVVGIIVNGLAATRDRELRRGRVAVDAESQLRRVLTTARASSAEDTQLAVRAELLDLLHLRDCWFTEDSVNLPIIEPTGHIDLTTQWWAREGFELPRDGVAIPAAAHGRVHGYLVCLPTPGVAVLVDERRVAAELGGVLGLVLGSRSAA